MTLNIPRHVFGCRRGYRTLGVSSDVSRAERDELETFSFGQTSAPTYLDSLELKPAYWCRCLGSKRWAITRVQKGATDDQGRSTLLFVSALLEPDDWVDKLGADSTPLLEASPIWAWNGEPVLEPVKIALGNRESSTPNSAQRARVLSMLALVEARHGGPNETIVATEFEFSPDDVRLLATLLPRACKASFSWAVRSLSEGLPVVVNSLSGNASRGSATRRITRWSRSVSYDQPTYTAALAFFWKPGHPPPWEFVANCQSFGQETWGQATPPTAVTRMSPQAPTARDRRSRLRGRPLWKRWYVGLAAILLAVVAATAVSVIQLREAKERERVRELQERQEQKELEENAKTLKAAVTTFIESNSPSLLPGNSAERDALIKKGEQLGNRIAELMKRFPTDELNHASVRMEEWLATAHESDHEHAEIERRLQEFRDFAKAEGLRDFTQDRPYPTTDTLTSAEEIEKQLETVVGTGTAVAQLYAENVEDARDRLAVFRDTCAAIDRTCAEKLEELREYFDVDLPDRLSNNLIEDVPKRREVLEALEKQMGNVLLENHPGSTTFSKDSFDKVTGVADEWRDRIGDLCGRFDKSYDKAAELIREHMLDLPDVSALDVPQRWGHARKSLELCQRALAIWSDHPECFKQEKLINDWIDQASSVAFEHFKSLVEQAERAWTSEEKEAERENRKPNPAYARDLVDEAEDYRKEIPDAIKQGDVRGEFREKAVQLQALLEPLSRKVDEENGDSGG